MEIQRKALECSGYEPYNESEARLEKGKRQQTFINDIEMEGRGEKKDNAAAPCREPFNKMRRGRKKGDSGIRISPKGRDDDQQQQQQQQQQNVRAGVSW